MVSSSAIRTSILERHLLTIDLPLDEDVFEATEHLRANEGVDESDCEQDSCADHVDKSYKKEMQYRRLLSISGTRFIARTRNLRIFKNKLPQIRSALMEMEMGAVAKSLDTRFEATVSVLYAILCPISDLSQALQSPELNLLAAQHLNLLTSQLNELRKEDEYKKLVGTVTLPILEQAASDEMTLRPQRKRCLPTDLNDSVVMHIMPVWSTQARKISTLLIDEYYELLDIINEQIVSRFDNPALGALSALERGIMTPALHAFCKLHDMDPETVERQLNFTALGLRKSHSLSPDCKLDLRELFCNSQLQQDLHYMTEVAITLPVTSSNAERAFSRLRIVKSHLRTTMSATRLQSLLRISTNKTSTWRIPLLKMVEEFTKSERRLVF